MAILQGNTYQVPVQVTDCKGNVITGDMAERGQFVFGSLQKFYGNGGDVWWSEDLKAFMVPLTEEETFAFKGVVKYQARLFLKDGSISGTIPQSEYIYESITNLRLSGGDVGVQSGQILKVALLKEVASVISNVVVDRELDTNSDNAISNRVVAGAINEINDKVNTVESIAKGATQAVAYKTYEAAVTAINELGADAFTVGQNVMIFTLSVPDLWISGVEETSEPYVFVDDDAIVNALKTDGLIRVGHYTLSALETGKVDLENYYTKNETDVLLENIPQGIEQLVGTEDRPINFATDMEVGKLYGISGHFLKRSDETVNMGDLNFKLCFKGAASSVEIYGFYLGNPSVRIPSITTRWVFDKDTGYYNGAHTSMQYVGTINGKGYTQTPNIYAPTEAGTVETILAGNGTGKAPTWKTPAELGLATEESAHKVLVLGANGTIGTNANFVVEDAESYIPYRNNLTEFVFSGIIPVTGEIDLTKEVTITFGDTSYYLFSAVDTSKRLTLGDLDFALRESLVTGYNYLFRTVFFENSDAVGFAVMPDKEDVLSLDSDQMDNFMTEGGLPNGQLVICKKVITNGYTEGGIYRFKITYPSTYEFEELVPSRLRELTLTQSGSMLQSTQTFAGQHIHAMIEFDTEGVHYGADFILHPCDSAICLVSYRFGTHDGTAYLDDTGRVNISIPDSLSFTNFKGHYIKL